MTTDTAPEPTAKVEHQALAPYVGLRPFSEDEFTLFFGREQERKLVASNLVASRLTLLYGPSGVGKSSLLNAAVLPHLRTKAWQQAGEDGLPTSAVVIFNTWRNDPVEGLLSSIAESLQPIIRAKGAQLTEGERSLPTALRSWTEQLDVDLYLILDQFEEYFLYHEHEGRPERFADEFPKVVNHGELRVNVLLSLREDALAKLDRFKGRIPRLFGNYLRTGYLDREAARQAITGPIAEHNRSAAGEPVEIEPQLVEQVLDQVEAGKVVLGDAGAGRVDGGPDESAKAAIETSHLQMVMARLWEVERSQGSRVLRASTLERLGGATKIVSHHLDEQLAALPDAQRDIMSRAFEHLVTRSGTKIAHSAADLAHLIRVPEAELAPVLERLSSGGKRILRPVEPAPAQAHQRYEIFHDVLAAAVLDWRRRWLAERDLLAAEEERQRKREAARRARRRALKKVATGAVMAIALAAVVLGMWSRNRWSMAQSRLSAALATSQLSVDPARSVEEALQGVKWAHTPQAESALRQAMADSHVRSVMRGHDDWVFTVAFNAAGNRIVTASKDGSARLWEAETGRPLAVLGGHTDQVVAAAFDPSGNTVVTASWDGTARLWDGATGEAGHVLERHDSLVLSASFDDTGRYVLTTSTDETARLWEATSGRELHVLSGHSGFVLSGAFGPGGTTVVTAGEDGTVRVWDTATGRQLAQQPENAFGWLNVAAFSPDGTVVASAGEFGVAYLWRWRSDEDPVSLLSESNEKMTGISFDPSGGHIVTAGNKTAEVWMVDTLSDQIDPIVSLEGHTDWVTHAVFSPNQEESVVATASQDGTARVWDVETGAELAVLRGHPDIVFNVAFSPDGRFIATAGSDGTARSWERPPAVVLPGHNDWVLSAEYSPDGDWVVTSGRDGTARVWDPVSGRQQAELSSGHFERVWARFSVDGRSIITMDEDSVRVWEWPGPAEEPKAELLRTQDIGKFQEVAFASDDSVLIADGFDVYQWLWRSEEKPEPLTEGEFVDELFDEGNFIMDLDVSPNGKQFITTHANGLTRIRQVDGGDDGLVLPGQGGIPYSTRFSDDGRLVVTGYSDGTARVWEADGGREVAVLHADGGLRAVGFSGDGDQVVAGSADGLTYIWDVSSERLLSRFRRHTDLINSVDFSPDGQRVVTAADDRTAKIYACATCRPLEELVAEATSYVDRVKPSGQSD